MAPEINSPKPDEQNGIYAFLINNLRTITQKAWMTLLKAHTL